MKQKIILLLLVLFWGASTSSVQFDTFAQSDESNEVKEIGLATMGSLPHLAIEAPDSVSMRTTSRKSDYRIDDLVSIDIAIKNRSGEPFYFFDLRKSARVIVRDEQGRFAPVVLFGTVFPDIALKDYHLLPPAGLDFTHLLLTIGCSRQPIISNEDKEFVNRGRGCIDIRKAGKYFVSSSSTNSFVVRNTQVGTLVGEMQSNSFEMRVSF